MQSHLRGERTLADRTGVAPLQPYVPAVAPLRAPGVLHQPVLRCRTHHKHAVVHLVPAVAENSRLVERPRERLHGHRYWSAFQRSVQPRAGDSLRVVGDPEGAVGLPAVLVLGDVGVGGLGVEAALLDVAEGVLELSSVAAQVAVGVGAVHQLLLRELLAHAPDQVGALHCCHHTEGPARGTHALVLHARHLALRPPVDVHLHVAARSSCQREPSRFAAYYSEVGLAELLLGEVSEVVDGHFVGPVGLAVVPVDVLPVAEEDVPPEADFRLLVLLAEAGPEELEAVVLLLLVVEQGEAGQGDYCGCKQNSNCHQQLQPAYIAAVMSGLYQQFARFLNCQQASDLALNLQVTSEAVAQLLNRFITAESNDPSCFGNEYFKEILQQVAETLINAVYRKQQVFANVEHLVAFTSVLQFLVHSNSLALPHSLLPRLEKYLLSFLAMQNIAKMRAVYQDSLNSAIIANFYKNVYLSAFEHRCRTLSREYGLQLRSCGLPRLLLQDLIEKNQVDLQAYESSVTCEWLTLSLVYYILAAKCERNKETPVLSKIIEKYVSSRTYEQCQRDINGKELCHFYNHVVLEKLARIESEEIDKMLDECEISPKLAASFLVTLILSDNNTVLDNIISSSWEP